MCAATVEKGIIVRKLQQSLSEAQNETALYKSMMEKSPAIMLHLDSQGKVLAVNHPERLMPITGESRSRVFENVVGSHNESLVKDVSFALKSRENVHVMNYPISMGSKNSVEYVNYSIYQSITEKSVEEGGQDRLDQEPADSFTIEGTLVVIEPTSPLKKNAAELSRYFTYEQTRTMRLTPRYLDGTKQEAVILHGTILNCT